MSDRLTMYNNALMHCGERALSSLTEARAPRRLLDQVWDSNGVKRCLEEGQWKFAMRSTQRDYDPDLDPQFGYRRGFDKPSDWVVTSALCSDEYFRAPLLAYFDEAHYWYCDLDTIYVRYVSDDDAYGLNINQWPESFAEFVSAHFASRIVWTLTGSESKLKQVLALREQYKRTAKNKDAMADPTKFPAPGSWTRARLRTGHSRDLGNLTGDLY